MYYQLQISGIPLINVICQVSHPKTLVWSNVILLLIAQKLQLWSMIVNLCKVNGSNLGRVVKLFPNGQDAVSLKLKRLTWPSWPSCPCWPSWPSWPIPTCANCWSKLPAEKRLKEEEEKINCIWRPIYMWNRCECHLRTMLLGGGETNEDLLKREKEA